MKKEVHELYESNNEHSLFLGTFAIDSGNKSKVLIKIYATIKPSTKEQHSSHAKSTQLPK